MTSGLPEPEQTGPPDPYSGEAGQIGGDFLEIQGLAESIFVHSPRLEPDVCFAKAAGFIGYSKKRWAASWAQRNADSVSRLIKPEYPFICEKYATCWVHRAWWWICVIIPNFGPKDQKGDGKWGPHLGTMDGYCFTQVEGGWHVAGGINVCHCCGRRWRLPQFFPDEED